jgi:hypothetical protein
VLGFTLAGRVEQVEVAMGECGFELVTDDGLVRPVGGQRGVGMQDVG